MQVMDDVRFDKKGQHQTNFPTRTMALLDSISPSTRSVGIPRSAYFRPRSVEQSLHLSCRNQRPFYRSVWYLRYWNSYRSRPFSQTNISNNHNIFSTSFSTLFYLRYCHLCFYYKTMFYQTVIPLFLALSSLSSAQPVEGQVKRWGGYSQQQFPVPLSNGKSHFVRNLWNE